VCEINGLLPGDFAFAAKGRGCVGDGMMRTLFKSTFYNQGVQ
jgi:hypothetical protein